MLPTFPSPSRLHLNPILTAALWLYIRWNRRRGARVPDRRAIVTCVCAMVVCAVGGQGSELRTLVDTTFVVTNYALAPSQYERFYYS